MPIIQSVKIMKVSFNSHKINNIQCGTSKGVNIVFEEIEVVNNLDKYLALDTIKNYTANYEKNWIKGEI